LHPFANASHSHSSSFYAFANNAAIEEDYFAPLSIETNSVRRKLCAAEKLGACLVTIPADQIFSVSASDFARTYLRDGADESASHEECTQSNSQRSARSRHA
jgi:hypothetical protein